MHGTEQASWRDCPECRRLPAELAGILEPETRVESGPGAGAFPAVRLEGVRLAAVYWKVTAREAMIELLEHGIWPLRFARNRGVFSAGEQARLLCSRAAIVGCGGLGGHMSTLLARVGVGALTLCDYDSFDESNLNRQLLAGEDNLGRNKAEMAAREVLRIASHVETRVHPVKADRGNLPEILGGADVAVDCLDSLPARRRMQEAAHAMGIPFVYGAIAGEEGFAMLCHVGGDGLGAVYGDEPPGGEKGAEAVVGVPTVTPAALASFEAALTIQLLLGRCDPEPILWHMDLSAFTIEPMRL